MTSLLDMLNSLVLALRCGARGLTDAARYCPGWLALAIGLHLVQSVIPAAQVVLINDVVGNFTTEPGAGGLGALLLLTLVVGAAFPLSQVAWQSSHRLGLRLTLRYQTRLLDVAARVRPQQLAAPSFVADLESAQLATGGRGPGLGAVPGHALQLATTVLTATALCLSIASISTVSGALVAMALLPTVVAFTFIARVELAGLPRLAAASRRATYATEQLLQQRSGTELATLQSGHKVARLAIASRQEYIDVLDGLTRFGTRMELACAVATAGILAGALVTMAVTAPTAASAAAAVAGIISGIHAIRACGNAFGQLVTIAPQAVVYDRVTATTQLGDPPPAPDGSTEILEVHDLHHTYPGATRPALAGVSFTARRGEIIGLVGINGAGKSTVVNALLGIIDPQWGSVLLDGRDAATLSGPARLARFGLLTQEFGRYEFSCRDTVELGTPRTDVTIEELWRALSQAGADGFVGDLPSGLDTPLGQQWGGQGLSGGQWQRIALARIHLRKAGIRILDEPTSAIDVEAERAIFSELRADRADHITIVVTHRADALRGMDQIHLFEQGRIVESGTFATLTAGGGRFAELFDATKDS